MAFSICLRRANGMQRKFLLLCILGIVSISYLLLRLNKNVVGFITENVHKRHGRSTLLERQTTYYITENVHKTLGRSTSLERQTTYYITENVHKIHGRSTLLEQQTTNITSINNLIMDEDLKNIGFESTERHEFKSPYIKNPVIYNENASKILESKQGQTKIISLHRINEFEQNWLYKENKYNVDLKRCPYNCELDPDGKKVAEADVVIFMCVGMLPTPDIKRRPGQLWVTHCYENKWYYNYPGDYNFWKNQFNLTMGYRLDSDIVIPMVRLGWRDSSLLYKQDHYHEIAGAKTKTATWWVRNCRDDRMDFVKEMQKYIDIDIFGKCGKKFDCPYWFDDFKCRHVFNTTYKFYLSFENAFCTDYVTEKLNKLFKDRTHIIPIVKGSLDYDRYFPSSSFVNGNKFQSAKDLALHLKELGKDLPRYSKMLQEKDRLSAMPFRGIDWCDVCEAVHTKKGRIISDIKQWSHSHSCTTSKYVPKI